MSALVFYVINDTHLPHNFVVALRVHGGQSQREGSRRLIAGIETGQCGNTGLEDTHNHVLDNAVFGAVLVITVDQMCSVWVANPHPPFGSSISRWKFRLYHTLVESLAISNRLVLLHKG